LTLITAPVTIIIQNQLEAAFYFLSLSINLCSLLTFVLIFLSKAKHILKHSAEEDTYDKNHDENMLRQKKEKYFKLKKENEDFKEFISKVIFFIK
jgi:hypothetical protein